MPEGVGEQLPELLPDGVYCFEEIFAVQGLKNNNARCKPTRSSPNGYYPLEIHKSGGRMFLVGYVDTKAISSAVSLWMRRDNRHRFLCRLALDAILEEESMGDGTPRNGFRLSLKFSTTNGAIAQFA
jgi:hypothetical protein